MSRARAPSAPAAAAAIAVALAAATVVACRDEKAARPAPSASASAVVAPREASAPPPTVASAVAPVDAGADVEEGCGETMITMGASCIDRHEVTTGEYVACVDRHACPPAPTQVDSEDDANGPLSAMCNARAPSDRADHPINCVSFAMADAYCKSAGKRLPTADEWMRAARGVAGGRYPWGSSSPVSSLLNGCGAECVAWKREHRAELKAARAIAPAAEMYPGDDGFVGTAPVGTFSMGASASGALDMAGNVEEWTADGVVRGGSWLSAGDATVRADAHRKVDPDSHAATVGFRCAR